MSPTIQNGDAKNSHKTDPTFLRKLLRQWENDPCLEFKSIVQAPACGEGVNFMSVVDRIVVTGIRFDGSPYQISLITKSLVADKCHQEVFKTEEIFSNEAKAYKGIPVLLGKDQKLVPNCLYADTELIVLEDLKSFGFVPVDKRKALDFEHTKLALEALGKFHAASFVLEYTEPEKHAEMRKEVKEIMFPWEGVHDGIKSQFDGLPKVIEFYLEAGATPEDDHAKEIAYFAQLKTGLYETIRELIRPKKYAVMCVGDCWITNLLFKYEDGDGDDEHNKKVSDVRLLDFQGARFASVAIDILYFLHTSVSHSVIMERNEELLKIYHSALTSKLFNLPKEVLKDLSMEWLKNEMKTHELYGFYMGLWVAPVTTMEEKHNLDGATVASLTAENAYTPEYMKDKTSPELLARIHDKCKYFIK